MTTGSVERSIQTALGPITGALPTTNTPPLTGQGILNAANLSTTPVKVLSAGNNNLIRRVSIMCVTAGRNIAWTTVAKNATAPTITAVGDGSANEGKLIMGGGGASADFNVADNLDLYIVASAASTAYQFTVVEQ
jgi:subtilase family serine protease